MNNTILGLNFVYKIAKNIQMVILDKIIPDLKSELELELKFRTIKFLHADTLGELNYDVNDGMSTRIYK